MFCQQANKISSDSPTSKKLHSAANSKDLKKFDASIKPEEIQKEWLDSRFEVRRTRHDEAPFS
jgi:hypothetical protein